MHADVIRKIVTPAVIESLLDHYQVPTEQRQTLHAVMQLFLKHCDNPKTFAAEVKKYTVEKKVSGADGAAACMVFTQIRADIDRMMRDASRRN